MEWLRLYTEITDDRKLRRLPPSQRWLWIAMMCIARKSPSPGTLLLSENVPVNIDDLADIAAIPVEDVKAGIQAFKAQRMIEEIDGVFSLINFPKRQFASDNSTERVKRYREKKKQEDETLQERFNNVSETPPEADAESDSDSDSETETKVKEMPAATTTEKEILQILRSVPNYAFDFQKDLDMIRTLSVDYPNVDLLLEIKRWRDFKLDHPLKKQSSPRLQIRNWMIKAIEFNNPRGDPLSRAAELDKKYTDIYIT